MTAQRPRQEHDTTADYGYDNDGHQRARDIGPEENRARYTAYRETEYEQVDPRQTDPRLNDYRQTEYRQDAYRETVSSRMATKASEPTLGDLFTALSQNFSTLMREEFRLAQAELKQKGKKALSGIISLSIGGFIAYAGFLMLLVAAIIGLAYWIELWLSALIVGAVVAIIGAIMISSGLGKLRNIDPTPHQTVETLQEDKEWIKRQVK